MLLEVFSTLSNPKRDLYKQYKDGGLLKYWENVTTFNGVDRQEDQFLFVECRLYANKENNNFSDNQIFDEKKFNSLNAPGDTYNYVN